MGRRLARPPAPPPVEPEGYGPPVGVVKPFDPPPDEEFSLENFVPMAASEPDPLLEVHTRVSGGAHEIAQKTRLNPIQKAVFSRGRLFAGSITSPHILAVTDIPEAMNRWIDELELHAISEGGWGAQRLTEALTARRYLPATGEATDQAVRSKRNRWFRP